MEIRFQSHHAKVSDHMRRRAEAMVRKAAARVPRAVSATVHFEQDGARRRVSVTLHAPRHHDLIGRAEGKFFGPALASAVARVLSQANKERKGLAKHRAHRLARART